MATVSVLMNGWNSAKYLREAIESVYAQTFTDWEIVFWDNASTDETAEIIQSYDERIKYFYDSVKSPLGKARNFALEKCKSKYIAFLDCDDVFLPTKLEKQVKLFESNPKLGLVYTDSIFFRGDKEVKQLYKGSEPPSGNIFAALLTNYFLSLETVMISREALDAQSEWFDNRLIVAEEADLFMRIAYGFECGYIDEILAKYRMHDSNESIKQRKRFGEENDMILEKLLKSYPDMQSKYPQEIALFNERTAIMKAIAFLHHGEMKNCRQALTPYLFKHKKMTGLYFSTMMGSKICQKLYSLIDRNI